MICPYCGNEMEQGEIDFTTAHISTCYLTYASVKERSKKGVKHFIDQTILGRNTIPLNKDAGETVEAYYCSNCEKVIAVFDQN